MLNILYGWLHFTPESTNFTDNVTEIIDQTYKLCTIKQTYHSGGLCNYTQYKPSVSLNDESYLITIIGTIALNSNIPQEVDNNIAQIILDNYQSSGLSFLENLKGQFILSIIDKHTNSCLIINDSMATFPLYYTVNSNQSLIFSNHLEFISKSPQVETKLNLQAVYDYIYFHMIPSPGTIYENIYKLEPKQYLLFENGQYTVKNYSPVVFIEDNSQSEEELAQEIFNSLEQSVKNSISITDKTGCFLSGGLDSSAVAGMLAKATKHAKTFSIGFPVKQYNEIKYARIASKEFHTHQYEYFIQPKDVHSVLHAIVSFMDEPFGNSSVIPVYYCAKLAKDNNIDHLLAGDGGDELFAGNTRYAKQQIFEAYFKVPKFIREKIIEPSVNTPFFTLPILKKVKSYVNQAKIPLPIRLETYNFLHIQKPEEVFTKQFLSKVQTNKPIELLNKIYHTPKQASQLNKMLYLDWKHTLADNDLRKVNMMCELAGVDVSYPMLNDLMIDLSCKIPSKLKLTPKKLRYLYKKSMQNFLPNSIINKKKHGFGLPFGIWTKTDKNLQKLAYSTITELKKYKIFTDSFLDKIIDKHQNDHSSFYGELVWLLMILGNWLDHHYNKANNNA